MPTKKKSSSPMGELVVTDDDGEALFTFPAHIVNQGTLSIPYEDLMAHLDDDESGPLVVDSNGIIHETNGDAHTNGDTPAPALAAVPDAIDEGDAP